MGTLTFGPRIRKREHLQIITKSLVRKFFFISSPTILFLIFSVFFNVALGDSSTTLTIPSMEWINLGTHLSGNAPVGLKDFGIGYSKDKNMLIIFGGTTASGNKNGQTYLADLNTLSWSSPKDSSGPQARSDMLYGMDVWGSYRNTFVISCGKGDGDVIFNDTWAFDVNYITWTQIKDVKSMSGPVPLLYSAIGGIDTTTQTGSQVTPNNTMWMSHGTDGTNFYTDLWAQVFRGSWTPNENSLSAVWYKVPTTGDMPKGRKFPAGAILPGGRLAIYGGCNDLSKDCAIPDVSALALGSDYNKGTPDRVTNAFWSTKSQCLGAREDAAMVMNGNSGVPAYTTQVIVFGGKKPKNAPVGVPGEVGVMDTSSGVWARVIPRGDSLPKTRAGARMIATGNVVFSASSNTGISDILMFGGEALDGSSTNFNDLWILRLYNEPASPNASKMEFLDCVKASDKNPTDGNSSGSGDNTGLSKSHLILSTLSYIFLIIATTVLRFGLGAVSIWSIGSIYGILIVASYATAFYGFAVEFEDKSHSYFSTTQGILGLILLVVLYILVPIFFIISLIINKKSISNTQTSSEESNDGGDGSGSGGSIGKMIATFLHLKSPESSKSPKSFEVNRSGNRSFLNNEDDSPNPMLKPAGDSWMEKRRSITESAVHNTSYRGSTRVSQSTSTSHHRLGSNGTPLTGSRINNPSGNSHQQKNSLATLLTQICCVVFHLTLFLMGIYIVYLLKTNSVDNLFFYLLIIFMVVVYTSWVIFACIGYPKSRDSMLVKLMTSVVGEKRRIEDSEESHGGSEGENSDNRTISRNPGTGTSHRDVINEEEMDEETKQAELEQEITNREVMVMTIPKRRLTVVNA